MDNEEKDALQSWWLTLSGERRATAARLAEGDPIPEDLWAELNEAGVPQAASWWPRSEENRQFAPTELVEFVGDQDKDAGPTG